MPNRTAPPVPPADKVQPAEEFFAAKAEFIANLVDNPSVLLTEEFLRSEQEAIEELKRQIPGVEII